MKNRNVSLDILKLLLAFMVVGLHTNFLIDISPLGYFLTVNGVFRVAVPIFLLINGYYFYSVISKAKQNFWLKRLLLLYITWMLFYSFFWLKVGSISALELVRLVQIVIFGYGHLWYISGLLISAALLLLLRRLPLVLLCIIIVITFTCAVTFQYLNNYYVPESRIINEIVKSYLYISAFSFFALGYSINRYNFFDKISGKVLVLLSLVGFTLLLGEAYLNYIEIGLRKGVDIYLSLIFICPVILLLFLKLNVQGANKYFSMYSTGIYLIHIFILAVFRKYTVFSETELTLLVILVSIVASYFLIQINKKFKFIL
jgi:surface polysaccharide O-acyltransferase-like enzyme